MTSILAFRIDEGNQMIVVGDTQHTFELTTSPGRKIFFFKDFLYCGSGFDNIIDSILTDIQNISDLETCANKIKELITKKYLDSSKGQIYPLTAGEVGQTEILLINVKTLEGYYIFGGQKMSLRKVNLIGSGNAYQGKIIEEYEKDFTTSLNVKEALFKKILKTFHDLGKNLPVTGHPALFKLEGYILEKEKNPKKFDFDFKYNLEDIKHYKVKEYD